MGGSDDKAGAGVETAAVAFAKAVDSADDAMVVAHLTTVGPEFLKPGLEGFYGCPAKDWRPGPGGPGPQAGAGPSPSTTSPAVSEGQSLSAGLAEDPTQCGAESAAMSPKPKPERGQGEPGGGPGPLQGTGTAPPTGLAQLLAILGRLSALDAEGWFQEPVTDAQAPNYSTIIRHPMCISVMRGKAAGGAYAAWPDFVRDFELLCSNAMRYNQKRSRIHKQVRRSKGGKGGVACLRGGMCRRSAESRSSARGRRQRQRVGSPRQQGPRAILRDTRCASQALIMLRAGKKLLVESELEGRKAIAAIAAAGGEGGATPSTPAPSGLSTRALGLEG